MELRTIKLKNFLSFKEVTHNFINTSVLIQGKNLTEIESKETNGAGKSTLMAGIAYAILATPLRKQTLDRDLITWGEEEADIWLDIYCPIRKETLNIHRTLRVKGSASLELTINEEVGSVKFATLADGNAYILKWIGISSEDIRNYYLINKENFKSFVACSNTDKLSLISRFIKAEKLDDAEDIIKEQNKPLEEKIRTLEATANKIEGELGVYKEQLEAEQARNLEEEKQAKIDKINDRIDSLIGLCDKAEVDKQLTEEKIKSLRSSIGENEKQVKDAVKFLEGLEKTDFSVAYDKIEAQRNETDKELCGLKKERDNEIGEKQKLETEIKHLNAILKGTITCPKCHHEFTTSNPDLDVSQAKKDVLLKSNMVGKRTKNIDDIVADIDVLAKSLKTFDEEFSKVRAQEQEGLAEVRKASARVSQLKLEVQKKNQQIELCTQEITHIDKQLTAYNEESEQLLAQLDIVENETIETRTEELQGLIAITQKKYDKACAERDAVRQEIQNNVQWGLRLKEFKMSLACEQLQIIQNFANMALQKQHSELRLSIDGFKRDAKGKLKSEITVTVINGDGEYKSFWSYSGGERARVEVALIQAFQEMINGTNPYGGLHFLCIDEVLEGTDPLGLALLLESLENVKYPVYIISHVMNIRAGVPTLTVVKENGFSYLE